MSDRIEDDGELFGDSASRGLWQQLQTAQKAEPSAQLRQRVLHDLNRHGERSGSWWTRLLPATSPQWVGLAAACCASLGLGLLMFPPDTQIDQRMARLEMQLDSVNQQLLISRLTATSPSARLAAVLQASTLAQRDATVASALLQRAATDDVPSVRSAAIGALGNEINRPETSGQIFELLAANDSPIVQIAIIDLILRHGELSLLQSLKQRASDGEVHPSLVGYVEETMGALEI